jgi:hypothetical protein
MSDPRIDQMMAASRDADRWFEGVRMTSKMPEPQNAVGTKAEKLAERFVESYNGPDGRNCQHVAGTGPQPVWGAAHIPGHAGCPDCLFELIVRKKAEREAVGMPAWQCDWCGAHDDRNNPTNTGMMQYGPLLLLLVICRNCAQEDWKGDLDGG